MASEKEQNSDIPDLSGLSEEERQKLLIVIQKAKEFESQVEDDMKLMRQPLEGLLSKYTNVMKGWQFRWFVLDPESGRLEYHEREEQKKHKPRGYVHLAGAAICPSDEDSQTFTVNAANGEIYRLRALDAKERQHWVNRLRATAEYHNETLAQSNPPLGGSTSAGGSSNPIPSVAASSAAAPSRSTLSLDQQQQQQHTGSVDSLNAAQPTQTNTTRKARLSSSGSNGLRLSPVVIKKRSHHKHPSTVSSHSQPPASLGPLTITTATGSSSHDEFAEVKDMLARVQNTQERLVGNIEDLPTDGENLGPLDKEMLLLKATSNATLSCLEQCLNILQQQQNSRHPTSNNYGATIEWLDPKVTNGHGKPTTPISPADSFVSVASMPPTLAKEVTEVIDVINHDEEVEDENEYTDTDLEGVEEHKSIILHLLSQLKLGMDLTKVVLPTFILEKRSLLEMFADCMAHPELFLRVPDLPTPEARMMGIVEWYLTSFHASRKGAIAKKPYNPIIGETFHCSWQCPDSQSEPSNGVQEAEPVGLYYSAEQVSHHPPVSAFYFESPDKQICMNASIYTKSKFMGMSIGVTMVGKVRCKLLSHNEEYEFSLPSAYARSILTVPWVELGDKISVACPSTGYSAAITFHTKPFYGGKLHRLSSEVKRPNGEVACKIQGEWNGQLEFTYSNGETKLIDTQKMTTKRKRVRPITKQGDFESRKLWQKVTNALKNGDIDTATEHKRFLEERQRQGERHRKETSTKYPTQYFHVEGSTWTFNKQLQPGQKQPSL